MKQVTKFLIPLCLSALSFYQIIQIKELRSQVVNPAPIYQDSLSISFTSPPTAKALKTIDLLDTVKESVTTIQSSNNFMSRHYSISNGTTVARGTGNSVVDSLDQIGIHKCDNEEITHYAFDRRYLGEYLEYPSWYRINRDSSITVLKYKAWAKGNGSGIELIGEKTISSKNGPR